MFKIYNTNFQEVINKLDDDICIVTDPPYNIGFKYHEYDDNLNPIAYYSMLHELIKNYPVVMINYPENIFNLIAYFEDIPNKTIPWVYNANFGKKQHRVVAYYNCTPDLNNVKQPYKNPNDKRIKKRIAEGHTGAKSYDWWNINLVKNTSKEKGVHPCPVPLKLMDNIIKSIPKDYVVCDPFMGGGTTGVASLQNNREFIGMECDKLYFDEADKKLNQILNKWM